MTDQPLRLGFIGAGNMGQCAHLRHYASLPECRVVALAEPRAMLAKQVAARYGIERVYSCIPSLLENETLDGLIAIQQFDRHGQIIAPLYELHLPILTEKPLCASIDVGEKMLAALEKTSACHYVGYHKRSDAATGWAKAEIERLKSTQDWGALKYIRITMPPGDWIAGGFDELISSDEAIPPQFQVPQDLPDESLNDEQWAQFVAFVNFYIHQINLLRYLLGENYRVTFADRSGVLLVAESESGVTSTLEMAPYQTALGWEESVLIGFEKGRITLRLPSPLADRPGEVEMLDGREGETQQVSPVFVPEGAMRTQAKNFLRAIRGESTPLCQAQEALDDLRVAREYFTLKNST